MCTFDRKTKAKISDCRFCGCGQSTQSGRHGPKVFSHNVKVGNTFLPAYKCGTCNGYMGTA